MAWWITGEATEDGREREMSHVRPSTTNARRLKGTMVACHVLRAPPMRCQRREAAPVTALACEGPGNLAASPAWRMAGDAAGSVLASMCSIWHLASNRAMARDSRGMAAIVADLTQDHSGRD